MSDTTAHPTDSRYAIPATSPEKERLAKQYAVKKAMYGWKKAVPDIIDFSSVRRIIDVGAGTCVWALDLLSLPEARTCAGTDDAMSVYVCDINTGFFPDKETLDELGITAFQQDVTKPFPEDLHGTFDLVHASFLVGGLNADGWRAALANYRSLLKPGGLVLLDETDTLYLPADFEKDPTAFDTPDGDFSKHLIGESWIYQANCVFLRYAVQKGFVVRITNDLPKMLTSAGFNVLHSKRCAQALGPLCRTVGGGSQAAFESFSVQNVALVMAYLVADMLKRGTLEAPAGRVVESEEEMRGLLQEIEEGVSKEGAVSPAGWFVARKQ